MSWNLSVFRTLLQDDIYGIATSVSQGFFQNIGDTRRQGIEAGVNYRAGLWSALSQLQLRAGDVPVAAGGTFAIKSLSERARDIQVEPGDHLPGIPEHRLKLGAEYKIVPEWTVGATLNLVSSFYYVGDESNQLLPIPGYTCRQFAYEL